jgi:hypothetical protein
MSILNHVPKNSLTGSRPSEYRRIDPPTGQVVGIAKPTVQGREDLPGRLRASGVRSEARKQKFHR